MADIWNRCDECGRFVAHWHFNIGWATRRLITPDSEFTKEEWETLCLDHAALGQGEPDA